MDTFFDAPHQADALYRFIGVCQVLAAILILVPRTATVGALMYLPVISGIYLLTVSLDFGTTELITFLMLVGNISLLCWDYDRLAVLWAPRHDPTTPSAVT